MSTTNEATPTQEIQPDPTLAVLMLRGELTARLVRAGEAFGAATVAHERAMEAWRLRWCSDKNVVWPPEFAATLAARTMAREELEAAALALHATR